MGLNWCPQVCMSLLQSYGRQHSGMATVPPSSLGTVTCSPLLSVSCVCGGECPELMQGPTGEGVAADAQQGCSCGCQNPRTPLPIPSPRAPTQLHHDPYLPETGWF